MEKDINEINRIERLTQEYFNNDEIRSGLKLYRSLMDLYPKEKAYYINYIGFLLDERVIVELLWSAYEEAIACCNRAIANVSDGDKIFFIIKKAEVYIIMIDGNYSWYTENSIEVDRFIDSFLTEHPNNIVLLKCAMAIFRMTGNFFRYEEILDRAIEDSPDDFMLVIQKVVSLQEKENYEMAISLLENWINSNPKSTNLNAAYSRMILLYKATSNDDMVDLYQDLLDNM
jgi:tetratricopeptide (TPR) repeat protein